MLKATNASHRSTLGWHFSYRRIEYGWSLGTAKFQCGAAAHIVHADDRRQPLCDVQRYELACAAAGRQQDPDRDVPIPRRQDWRGRVLLHLGLVSVRSRGSTRRIAAGVDSGTRDAVLESDAAGGHRRRESLAGRAGIGCALADAHHNLAVVYPTAYAVFLLFFPFLTQGLRSLGKTAHGALCTIMVVLYTVLDMVMPLSAVGLPGGNVRSFIYIYTLIAYYRWYMKPLTTATAWWTLAGGYALIVVGALGGGLLYQHTGKLQTLQVYLGKVEFRLPVLMVGLTMFVLFERHEFHNHAVNAVAASTFGVYLISEYPTVRQWIWNNPWLDFGGLYRSPAAFVLIVLSVCAVFAGCVVLDAVRRLLFRITIDRRRGRWFDLLWEHLRRKLRHADYRTEHIENR